jgi:hypothetical protein
MEWDPEIFITCQLRRYAPAARVVPVNVALKFLNVLYSVDPTREPQLSILYANTKKKNQPTLVTSSV